MVTILFEVIMIIVLREIVLLPAEGPNPRP